MDDVTNVSDPVEVKKAKKKAERLRRRHLADVRYVLAQEAGRRFMWNLIGMCNTDGLSFVARDASTTCFNEGMRVVGNTVRGDIIEAEMDGYFKMQMEAKTRKENKDE